jgi:predicted HicB family RNase H-like nuclease
LNLSKISALRSINSSSQSGISMNSVDHEKDDQKRISILVTKRIHKEIKLHALKADKSMKDYVLEVVMKSIGISQ